MSYRALYRSIAHGPMSLAHLLRSQRADPALYVAIFYLVVLISAIANAPSLNFHPDAYYYFTVARNVTEGAGFTFDGVSVTTGYHPLWLGVSTAVYYIFSDLGSFHYAILSILTVLFVAGHALLASDAVHTGISLRSFMVISLLLFSVNLAFFQFSGLENTLFFFLLSLFLWLHYRNWRNHRLGLACTALVLVLIYFARLDAIFLIAVYLAWYAVSRWRDRDQVAAVTLPALVTAAILAHWLFMLVAFDTVAPTSQIAIREQLAPPYSSNILEAFSPYEHPLAVRIQEVLETLGANLDPGTFTPDRYLGLVAPASLLLGLYLVVRASPATRWPIIAIGLMSVLQLVYYAVFMNGWMRYWYFSGWYIVVLFGAAYLLSGVMDKLRPVPIGALIGLALLAFLVVNVNRANVDWSAQERQSLMLRDYDLEGVILVGNTPDRASFLSGVPIRHLEGLLNGYDYLRSYVEPGRIASYIQDVGATHFVISNAPRLPDYLECRIEIARNEDGGLTAYGTYDRHNGYVAVYRITVGLEAPPDPSSGTGPNCGPAENP